MPDFPFRSREDHIAFFSHSSPEEFTEALTHLPLEEIAESFAVLQDYPSSHHAEEKLNAAFDFIKLSGYLETFGKRLSTQQFIHILSYIASHPTYQDALTDLLVGLPPSVFKQSLNLLKPEQMALFKAMGLQEPLQYHLLQFIHSGETLYHEVEGQIREYVMMIQTIQPQNLAESDLDGLRAQIESLRSPVAKYLNAARVALSMAWNTDRIDLIEKLSTVNETLHHMLSLSIGHPRSEQSASSGLYARLDAGLATIFDKHLKNEDPAIEGLTRLSLWHLIDYWELGLLPDIRQSEATEPGPHLDRQKLLHQVQKNLERLHIGSVAELKRQSIYSRTLLKGYIDRHLDLLS